MTHQIDLVIPADGKRFIRCACGWTHEYDDADPPLWLSAARKHKKTREQ